MKHILFSIILWISSLSALHAQQDSTTTSRLKRYWNSLAYGNVDRTFERKMDLSFIVAPCYTREGSLGIGGAATALYRLDRRDSVMQPSDITLTGSATIKGFYALTAGGNNHFRGNRSRLTYLLELENKNLDFWGVSYEACAHNPISGYRRQMVNWKSDYVYKWTKAFHLGATLNLNYTHASHLSHPDYLEGEKSAYFFTGVGLSLQYDTRDFLLNPRRGIYFLLREVFYPSWLSTHNRTLYTTSLVLDAYRQVWSGGILAFDLYGQYNGDEVPWTMREELGSDTKRMRGYYAGRYIDNNQLAAQLELRQHIYGRVGCVAWAGGGTVFPSFEKLRLKNLLPNYGLGLRIEFKHQVNFRIDYGFGKDTGGFVFQYAEAF